jgi:cellulose 1,4-beta-cellobiosidase
MHIPKYVRPARTGWAGRRGFPVGLLVLAGLLAAILPAFTAGTAASATTSKQLCRRYQHVSVHPVQTGRTDRYWVRNDFWGTGAMCMSNSGKQTNFTVTEAGHNLQRGAVMAFPYIFTGCSWGICTKGSGLPAKASTLKDPESSWSINANAGGVWDASYDLWFSRHRIVNGQAKGAELMIWLNSSNIPPFSKKHLLWIDGAQWYFVTWKTPPRGGLTWRYIQFRRVHPTSQVKNLNLGAFIRAAEQIKAPRVQGGGPLVQPDWWLMNIEAGFELTKGGAGLATNSFSAHL